MRQKAVRFAFATVIACAATGVTFAQTPAARTPEAAAPAPEATANRRAVLAAVDRLRGDMQGIPANGDMDLDFVDMMIFHHQGAIDMANLYLGYGRDPTIRQMVQRIIVDREREIAEFRVWQGNHPAPDRWLAEQAAPVR